MPAKKRSSRTSKKPHISAKALARHDEFHIKGTKTAKERMKTADTPLLAEAIRQDLIFHMKGEGRSLNRVVKMIGLRGKTKKGKKR